MVNPLFNNMMAKYLNDNGYIKFSTFLWGKNVKTDIVTGNVIVVNLASNTITVMKLKDHFLFLKRPPKIEMVNTKYNTITEFQRYVVENERIQLEFLKKQKEWRKKNDRI